MPFLMRVVSAAALCSGCLSEEVASAASRATLPCCRFACTDRGSAPLSAAEGISASNLGTRPKQQALLSPRRQRAVRLADIVRRRKCHGWQIQRLRDYDYFCPRCIRLAEGHRMDRWSAAWLDVGSLSS